MAKLANSKLKTEFLVISTKFSPLAACGFTTFENDENCESGKISTSVQKIPADRAETAHACTKTGNFELS